MIRRCCYASRFDDTPLMLLASMFRCRSPPYAFAAADDAAYFDAAAMPLPPIRDDAMLRFATRCRH